MAIRLAIVDGTGPATGYAKAMEKSFCHVLSLQLGSAANYQRGPNSMGMETLPEAARAFGWCAKEYARDPSVQIMLAGYSRGGSAVIMAAEQLETIGVPVHSMFLFDPVARHPYPGGEVIPGNVAFSRIARRDQSWSFVMKYEGTLSDSKKLGDSSNPCRPFFGNTGLNWRGLGDHQTPSVFKGSHGALGGVGWKFVTEDAACQLQVSAWMGQQMRSRGLMANLGPGFLDPTPPEKPATATKLAGQALDAGRLAKSALGRIGSGGSGL